MSGSRQLVEQAVSSLAIHSPTSYSWFGQIVQLLPERVEKEMPPATARAYLHYSMQTHLYENFYCRGGAAAMRESPLGVIRPGFTPFVQRLSASNVGNGTREPGWRVRGTENRTVIVERHGLSLWLSHEDTWPRVRRRVPPRETTVSVRFPKELLQLSPGFYMALGDRWLDAENGHDVLRFYWHLRSDGANALVAAATVRLNRARLPFRLKVVSEPERYLRCDAGVLYARKRDYALLASVVRAVYADVSSQLEPTTPVFAKRLAPGLGLAEDPGHGDSFGMHRCGLLAEGIIRAHEQSRDSVTERFKAVEQYFEETGISLSAPFLNPGSKDRYGFPVD